jgi:hypothetical protein
VKQAGCFETSRMFSEAQSNNSLLVAQTSEKEVQMNPCSAIDKGIKH